MKDEELWGIVLVTVVGGLAAGATGYVVGKMVGEAGSPHELIMYVVPSALSIGGAALIYGLRSTRKLQYKLMQTVAVLMLSVGLCLGTGKRLPISGMKWQRRRTWLNSKQPLPQRMKLRTCGTCAR